MPIDYSKWEKIKDSDDDDEDGSIALQDPQVQDCSLNRKAASSSRDVCPVSDGQNSPKRQSQFRHVCCYCGTHAEHTKKCSGCMNAHYCSAKCQTEHWEVQKSECKMQSKKRDDLLGKRPQQEHALNAMLKCLMGSSNTPFFECPDCIGSDANKHVSHLKDDAEPASSNTLVSLEAIVEAFRTNIGPGVLIIFFSNACECEDFALSLGLAARDARVENCTWIIGRSIGLPKHQYHTWPSDDALACSGCQSIAKIDMADHLITSPGENRFPICGYICPLEGQPRSAAIRGVTGEIISKSSAPTQLQSPPKGLRSSFDCQDAVEVAYDVARKIETDAHFQQCRMALSFFQRRWGKKGIVWIRHTKKPSLHGFLVEELRSLTPQSLTKAANIELKKLANSNNVAELNSLRIVFLAFGTHSHILKEHYHGFTDSVESKYMEDVDLNICHCFFNTWCAADNDSCVATPLHFPVPSP